MGDLANRQTASVRAADDYVDEDNADAAADDDVDDGCDDGFGDNVDDSSR